MMTTKRQSLCLSNPLVLISTPGDFLAFCLYDKYFLCFKMKTIGPSKDCQPLTFRTFDVWANIFRTDGIEIVTIFGPLKKVMV